MFDVAEESIKSMTICPRHRATLGISWIRGGGTRCRVPQAISGHGRSRGTWPKGDRGLGKQDSAFILRNTGYLSLLDRVILLYINRIQHLDTGH